MTEEIWKDIPGYEGKYQISNMGRVKSLKRTHIRKNGWTDTKQERILKPGRNCNGKGYLFVNLKDLINNKKPKVYQIHQLVAVVFLNHIPDKNKNIVVDHKDNDKLNNKLENLQLVTQRFNNSKDRKGTSKYTGVSWNKSHNMWKVQITINKKQIHLGYFKKEEEAAQAYQNALKKLNQ